MTGYGAADGPLGGGHLSIEIRTVNHRHFSVQLRLPAPLLPLESAVRNHLRGRIERGHLTLAARWTEEPGSMSTVRVNLPRAQSIVNALQQLQQDLGLSGEIDLTFIARQPDILIPADEEQVPIDRAELLALLDQAVDGLTAMRDQEGSALAAEISRLLDEIARETEAIAVRAPKRLSAERERLTTAVTELLDGKPADPDRLAQEIAILADKLDVTEELVRLRTHIDACRTLMTEKGAVGRRLSFLGQEMLREANTIGSKANDAPIAQAVVRIKGELEKVREQVENLE